MSMMKVFVFNMKKYRKKRKLSQMKLAEMLNTSTSYIGSIEINKKVPSMEMVEKIAKALNIEPFKLFIDDKDRTGTNVPVNDDYLECLTTIERQDLTERIISLISNNLEKILQPENRIKKK
jgi:transcriptional regulator with XRE-family HTH domain